MVILGRIDDTIRLVRDFWRLRNGGKLRAPEPRIAVAGLNPHCEPIFGDEEVCIFSPFINFV